MPSLSQYQVPEVEPTSQTFPVRSLEGVALPMELAAARARRLRYAVTECVARLDDPMADLRTVRAALVEAVELLARVEDELRKPRVAIDLTPANAAQEPGEGVEVSHSGRVLRTRHGVVDIGTRGAPRRVLQLLADRRLEAPGQAITLDEVFAAGWPGQRVHPEACASRVYVALSMLRRMGLRGVLIRRDDGYLLDPSVPCVRIDDLH
jgi:hypothetical protein